MNDIPGDKASANRGAHSSGLSSAASQNTARSGGGQPIIAVTGVTYTLDIASKPLHILKDVNFRVDSGDVVAIVGPSGSGKTSLLMLLAGLERPTSGTVLVAGQELTQLSEDGLAVYRRQTVGIVFQSFHLIPSLTALDNVALALEIANPDLSLPECRKAAAEALTAVGLGERGHHRPSALSGGEQQRVGLARAMIAKPKLLLADEPTGNLDQKTGERVIELMFGLARKQGTSVVLITHDPGLAARADRTWTMTLGQLIEGGAPHA